MRFEINDLKSIGEALEGIVEKMQEQFTPTAFDITLNYPGLNSGTELVVRMTSIENEPWRFAVDITEADKTPEPLTAEAPPEHTWDDHSETEVMPKVQDGIITPQWPRVTPAPGSPA